MTFRELVKELRAEQRKSLRRFCSEHGYDPSNWSKMERGVSPPPKSGEALARWAVDLGLKEGTEGWDMFMYRAAVARGEIPAAILKYPAVERKLPFLFLAMTKTSMSEEDLDKMATQIENTAPSEWRQW